MTYREALQLAHQTANTTGQWVEIWYNGSEYRVCIKGAAMVNDFAHVLDISPKIQVYDTARDS